MQYCVVMGRISPVQIEDIYGRQNCNVTRNIEIVIDRVNIIVGKRKKCLIPVLFAFPTMLSKALLFIVIKIWHCLVGG